MSIKFSEDTWKVVRWVCPECGGKLIITASGGLVENRTCPNGHCWWFLLGLNTKRLSDIEEAAKRVAGEKSDD